jgi:hypothetical protein
MRRIADRLLGGEQRLGLERGQLMGGGGGLGLLCVAAVDGREESDDLPGQLVR